MRACVRAGVRACMRVCLCVRARVCACVRAQENLICCVVDVCVVLLCVVAAFWTDWGLGTLG